MFKVNNERPSYACDVVQMSVLYLEQISLLVSLRLTFSISSLL